MRTSEFAGVRKGSETKVAAKLARLKMAPGQSKLLLMFVREQTHKLSESGHKFLSDVMI
jgi:hypothetical protein